MPEPRSIADGLSDGALRRISEAAERANRYSFKLKISPGDSGARGLYSQLTPSVVRAMAEELLLWRANAKEAPDVR